MMAKQIQEMAKTLCANCRKDGYSCSLYSSDDDWVCAQERERAEFFYNAGYRKVCEPIIKDGKVIGFVDNADYIPKSLFTFGLSNTRKKTAEKIFAQVLEWAPVGEDYHRFITNLENWLKERYDVEIE